MTETETKWFMLFKTLLAPVVAHAQSLGHTAVVMLYAAVQYLGEELRAKSGITEEEAAHAKAIVAEARKS